MEQGMEKVTGKVQKKIMLERRVSMRSRRRLEDLPGADSPQRPSRTVLKNLSPMTRFVATKRHPDWEVPVIKLEMRRRPNLIDIVKSKRRLTSGV